MFYVVNPVTPTGPFEVRMYARRGGAVLVTRVFDTHAEATAWIEGRTKND